MSHFKTKDCITTVKSRGKNNALFKKWNLKKEKLIPL